MTRYGVCVVGIAVLAVSLGWAQGASPQSTSAQSTAAQPSVSGTVVYRERMALPPDAAIEVKLQDISGPKGTANTIAETVFGSGGKQVPIPFQISYNPADINPAHKYQVQANIRVNGKLMFTGVIPYLVITNGEPSQVALLLERAPEKPAQPAGRKLTGTNWKLVQVNGQPAVAAEGSEAHIFLEKKGMFSGSTGCNQMTGSFIASEGALQFTPGGMTMKMCAQPLMEQEQALVAAIKATTNYEIDGDALELLNGTQPLAQFAAKPKQ
ncbi:MAG: YbaY family lipoprotein [Candidatus Korobacteraceae bacterium]